MIRKVCSRGDQVFFSEKPSGKDQNPTIKRYIIRPDKATYFLRAAGQAGVAFRQVQIPELGLISRHFRFEDACRCEVHFPSADR
jgi:hypothetical protein